MEDGLGGVVPVVAVSPGAEGAEGWVWAVPVGVEVTGEEEGVTTVDEGRLESVDFGLQPKGGVGERLAGFVDVALQLVAEALGVGGGVGVGEWPVRCDESKGLRSFEAEVTEDAQSGGVMFEVSD